MDLKPIHIECGKSAGAGVAFPVVPGAISGENTPNQVTPVFSVAPPQSSGLARQLTVRVPTQPLRRKSIINRCLRTQILSYPQTGATITKKKNKEPLSSLEEPIRMPEPCVRLLWTAMIPPDPVDHDAGVEP